MVAGGSQWWLLLDPGMGTSIHVAKMGSVEGGQIYGSSVEGEGSTTTWLRAAGSMASYPALIRPSRVFATADLVVHAMEASLGSPESSSPPQPRPRGGGPREATWSRARCPTPGRAAFPSPDLNAARRELQALLCDSVFLDVHHLRVQEVINYGLLLVREVLCLLMFTPVS